MIDSEGNAHINTGGGAYVGDHLNVGGDFVGRDQITHVYHEDQRYDVAGLPNPFLGLEAFRYEDRAKFGGRRREISAAIARMTEPGQQQTLVFVIGASGSGKSSFAQAGLLPALEEYYQRQGKTTRCEVFKPANNPINRRDEKLAALNAHPDAVRLLVIDQFEELFTQSSKAQREAMFAWLIGLPSFEQSGLRVIATMRSDYLPDLLAQMTLHDIARQGIDLRQMQADELSEAIQAPVWAAYPDHIKQIEPSLVERLAKNAGASPTLLPLLQVTLQDLWKNGEMKLAGYGTLADAIQQRAEQVFAFEDFNEASPCKPRGAESQSAMMDTLLGLVRVDTSDDIRRDVRRARPLAALEQGRESLVDDLARARLLSVEKEEDSETVNIIHEALIANWKRLSDAIAARREQLRKRERFEQQLKQWQDNGKSEQYLLLTDVQLGEARELDKLNDVVMRSAEARELLRSSAVAQEAERQRELDQARKLAEEQRLRVEQQVQANKRLRLRNIGLVIVTILAVLAAVGAGLLAEQARVNEQIAEKERLSAESNKKLAEDEQRKATEAKENAEQSASEALKQKEISRLVSLRELSESYQNEANQYYKLGLILDAKNSLSKTLSIWKELDATVITSTSFSNAIISSAQRAKTYNLLALICLEKREFSCADENSKKAIELDSNPFSYFLARSLVIAERGEFISAKNLIINEATSRITKPDDFAKLQIGVYIAQISILQKDWPSAEIAIKKILDDYELVDVNIEAPLWRMGANILIESYYQRGKKDQSCGYIERYYQSLFDFPTRQYTFNENAISENVEQVAANLNCKYRISNTNSS